MSKTRWEFAILTVLLLATRVWDAAATYAVTPDLARETNPIVSLFGQGWTGVLVAQAVLVSVVIVLSYYSLFRVKRVHPSQDGLGFRDFVALYYFGEEKNLTRLLYEFPADKRVLTGLLGYVLPRTLIVVGAFISLSSMFLARSVAYRGFYAVARPYYYGILAGVAIAFCVLFFRREYAMYGAGSPT
ncbi:MAG: hypothetical protein KAW67_00490 [Candidatus Eisenbacteria sp.]|nr:hypothetical protein [Candidatus Eisenbacteria bacterium]